MNHREPSPADLVVTSGRAPDSRDEQTTRPGLREAARRCRPGEVLAAHDGARDMVVAALADGRVFALPDDCPHTGLPLSVGYMDGDRLVCPHHGWAFDLESGRCAGRPQATVESTPIRALRRPRASTTQQRLPFVDSIPE